MARLYNAVGFALWRRDEIEDWLTPNYHFDEINFHEFNF